MQLGISVFGRTGDIDSDLDALSYCSVLARQLHSGYDEARLVPHFVYHASVLRRRLRMVSQTATVPRRTKIAADTHHSG